MRAEGFTVVALGWDGVTRDRIDGFCTRREAEREAVQQIARSDIGSVVVRRTEQPNKGNGRYR